MANPNEPLMLAGGIKSLAISLRKIGDTELSKEMRKANKDAADQIVPYARRRAPVRSGRLRASIGTTATRTTARIKAGSKARVPYARRIHSGGYDRKRGRKIRGTPFIRLAIPEAWPKIEKDYIKAMNRISAAFARKHGGHKVVGGPRR